MTTRRELLKVEEFCEEVKIARSTFYEWKAKGLGPRCRKLPNGQLRIDRRDIDDWYDSCEVAA
ncbi:helix-turn-helix transcriptional regulator [Kutzneria sp. CA-103260]|uniref:helix-turn-helix transcriptional regulator n=1 Tax=Kutzneria sp. CA-103260 TaxID=2802641 RepID=UPI001BA6F672|nr:helix-turn-helix domain-containing protein [Kutzneria sp. CA-103260]QUQ70571.1 helix-turn-helix domain-containing protein [Kutzneria sp. CA-103260]